jgi:hypothetical protein
LHTAFTAHATVRAQQRHFREDEIDYVRRHGQVLHRTGICFYFLGARDVPLADRRQAWTARLIGTTLLIEGDDLITIYKNPHGLRCIKRKLKYNRYARRA